MLRLRQTSHRMRQDLWRRGVFKNPSIFYFEGITRDIDGMEKETKFENIKLRTSYQVMNSEELKKIKKDWADRGFPAKVWNDPAGQRWENYVHSVDELFMVLKGEYELQLGDQKTYPKIGEEVFIPANLTHCVRNIGGTPASFLYAYKQ